MWATSLKNAPRQSIDLDADHISASLSFGAASSSIVKGTKTTRVVRSLQVLQNELELHQVSAEVAESVASDLHDIACAQRSASCSNTAVRWVLRKLRDLRAGGNFVGRPRRLAGNPDLARLIWKKHFEASTAVAMESSVYPKEVKSPMKDGVVFRVIPPLASDKDKTCFLVCGLLTDVECQLLHEKCDAQGWHAAALDYGLGSGDLAGDSVVNLHLRDSDRCIVWDSSLALAIWEKLRPLIPTNSFEPLHPTGINSCFRCLRYIKDQAGFSKHIDGSSVVAGEISKLTVQIYLNDGFAGGATRLCVMDESKDAARAVDVVPHCGMAFVFDQSILHSGRPVDEGTKLTARTEIMYS